MNKSETQLAQIAIELAKNLVDSQTTLRQIVESDDRLKSVSSITANLADAEKSAERLVDRLESHLETLGVIATT